MPNYTANINLLKKDPIADKKDTFNIEKMLNENWDKVDVALGERVDKSEYTAEDVLEKLKSVDGSGSGVDADTIDGLESSKFARVDIATDLFANSTAGNSRLLTKSNYGCLYRDDITTTMSLTSDMADSIVNVNSASAIALTVDIDVFKRGDLIHFERQGLGTITFIAGAGFTLYSPPDNTKRSIKGHHAMVTLKFDSPTQATLFGSIE